MTTFTCCLLSLCAHNGIFVIICHEKDGVEECDFQKFCSFLQSNFRVPISSYLRECISLRRSLAPFNIAAIVQAKAITQAGSYILPKSQSCGAIK